MIKFSSSHFFTIGKFSNFKIILVVNVFGYTEEKYDKHILHKIIHFFLENSSKYLARSKSYLALEENTGVFCGQA